MDFVSCPKQAARGTARAAIPRRWCFQTSLRSDARDRER